MNRNAIIIAAIFAFLWIWPGFVYANEHSELLQACIDENREMPNGHYQIDEPLRTAYNKSVSNVIGQGTPSTVDRRFWTGHGTYIEWIGPDNAEAMVYFESCDSEITHVTLDCAGKANHGLLFTKREPNSGLYAPGSNTSDRLAIHNAKVAGIAFGGKPGEEHCDEFVCRFYQSRGNPVGVLSRNSMSMMHRFEHVQSYHTDVAFRYEGGGYLSLQTITQLHKGTILEIDHKLNKWIDQDTGKTKSASTIGSGNRLYTVHEVKSDATAGDRVKLLDMHSDTKVNVSFGRVLLAKESKSLMTLRGPCVVTIGSMDQGILPQSITAHATNRGIPNLAIYRSQLPAVTTDAFTPGSKAAWQIEDRFLGDGYQRRGNYRRHEVESVK